MKYIGQGKVVSDVFRFIDIWDIVEVYEYEECEERDSGNIRIEDGEAEYKIYYDGGGIDANEEEIEIFDREDNNNQP